MKSKGNKFTNQKGSLRYSYNSCIYDYLWTFLPCFIWFGSGLMSVCISSNCVLTSLTVLKLGRKTDDLIQANFLLSALMLQNLLRALKTGRYTEHWKVLCKDHERISRENLRVCRFLGSVLIVSNSTFGANLERLHGAGSPLPCRVPPPIRCRSFPWNQKDTPPCVPKASSHWVSLLYANCVL